MPRTREEVKKEVIDAILERCPADKAISSSDNLKENLCLDDLDLIEVVMSLEEIFGIEIPDEHSEGFHTVADVQSYVLDKLGIYSEASMDKKAEPYVTRLVSSRYHISKGKFQIHADIVEGQGISLYNASGDKEFIFQHSKPEVIAIIADLIKEAAKLRKET